jgi:hypothetical protein
MGGIHGQDRYRTARLQHAWKLDPIVRSLIDTDFYKLLMLQMIWKLYPDVDATFTLINRTKRVHLAEEIDEGNCASSSIMPARSSFRRRR